MFNNFNLKILCKPYMYLLVGQEKDFYDLLLKYISNENTKCIYIDGKKCYTIDKLFKEFAKKLNFPNYFGYNWSAFDECINDLDWLSANSYILFISNINKVLQFDKDNFKVFMRILKDTMDEWTNGRNYDSFPTPPTPFYVVFHCIKEKENKVINLIKVK